MQEITKNPPSFPSVFGINAGAVFFLFCVAGLHAFTWFSAISVYSSVLLGREGLTLLKLTLAGAAIAALQGFLVLNEAALDQVLFWLAGFVQGRKIEICVS